MPRQFIPGDCSVCGAPLIPNRCARGMCHACYMKKRATGPVTEPNRRNYFVQRTCSECNGALVPHRNAYGMCWSCYLKKRDRANPEATKVRAAKHVATHNMKAERHASYMRHRKQRIAEVVAYMRARPDYVAELRHRRRAHLKEGEHIDYDAVYARDNGLCHICGKHVDRKKMSIDHLIPICYGGPHTFQNVRPAHRSCNSQRQHLGPAQLILIP